MAWVWRKYRCEFDHEWQALVEQKAPMPEECPTCMAIVSAGSNNPPPPAIGEVETPETPRESIGAPMIRSERARAVQRFEGHAFKRANCDDERILLGNLKDNVREGETYAVPETVSTNETMRMMHEQAQQAKAVGANPTPWGFQPVDGATLAAAGGPQNPVMRPVVDIKSKRAKK